MKSYTKIKNQLLKDRIIHQEYRKLDAEFALAKTIIEKRLAKGFTQAALAHKIGTKQSSIARLESGNYNPSMAFLEKIAKALDTKVVISLLK
jgi:ribosome-binding protein aMBF1 (putative translation factor)